MDCATESQVEQPGSVGSMNETSGVKLKWLPKSNKCDCGGWVVVDSKGSLSRSLDIEQSLLISSLTVEFVRNFFRLLSIFSLSVSFLLFPPNWSSLGEKGELSDNRWCERGDPCGLAGLCDCGDAGVLVGLLHRGDAADLAGLWGGGESGLLGLEAEHDGDWPTKEDVDPAGDGDDGRFLRLCWRSPITIQGFTDHEFITKHSSKLILNETKFIIFRKWYFQILTVRHRAYCRRSAICFNSYKHWHSLWE